MSLLFSTVLYHEKSTTTVLHSSLQRATVLYMRSYVLPCSTVLDYSLPTLHELRSLPEKQYSSCSTMEKQREAELSSKNSLEVVLRLAYSTEENARAGALVGAWAGVSGRGAGKGVKREKGAWRALWRVCGLDPCRRPRNPSLRRTWAECAGFAWRVERRAGRWVPHGAIGRGGCGCWCGSRGGGPLRAVGGPWRGSAGNAFPESRIRG